MSLNQEFFDLVSSSGAATFKELRKITVSNKGKQSHAEFDLISTDGFDEHKFANLMADRFDYTFLDVSELSVSDEVIGILQKKTVEKYRLIVIQDTKDKCTVCSFDPLTKKNVKTISDILGKPCSFVLTTISAWKSLYEKVQLTVEELVDTIEEFKEEDVTAHEDDSDVSVDVVNYVNRILADGYHRKASDIHFEPYEKKFRVRLRIDGNLIELAQPPRSMVAPMISRLKILAQLDISEKRLPQDGRIKMLIGGKPIDYRVSTLPTLFGEKIVLRLLDQSNLELDMTKLGFMKHQLSVFKESIHQPYGMCLVTGPTGSGKTTTLYSALAEINTPENNISTAEDPCEFNLEGINQVNVRKDIGLSFASALKSFLRQDPDIIMVGEIRDLEVGEIAIEAALTGHMVFSTLHTNDASSTITRLLNMGIEPFLVVAALNVVVAQRLCKRLCSHCKEEVEDPEVRLVACGLTPESAKGRTLFKPKGCDHCGGSGYKGRVAVHEVLKVTPLIREMILAGESADELKKVAIFEGMRTLRMSAIMKVLQGITSLEEAVTNTASDNLF